MGEKQNLQVAQTPPMHQQLDMYLAKF
uniref:Uncharacterized protein n=1 Tax=Rhizophora mucronata TaxID=61149 RepID=A0A2P2PVD8_RHIMU